MTRLLVTVHRWLGIVLCLFFAMWFASGMVMMYVPFPSLPDQDRLAYLDTIAASGIRIDPGTAVSRCPAGRLSGLRLISIAGRPAYICHVESMAVAAVFADDGSAVPVPAISAGGNRGPFDYDQWVVHQRFDPYRPFFRQDLNDAAGTQLYLSSRTGEIVLQTTARQRAWNYVGAVVHWIYPTVLRKDWALWDRTVWWLSLAGIAGVLIGLYLGGSAFFRVRRLRRAGLSPYRGWLRWHHVLGLVTGLVVFTWIFSGWLSMDHGRLFSIPDPTAEQVANFRGRSLREIAGQTSRAELTTFTPVKEISFHAVAGNTLILGRTGSGDPLTRTITRSELVTATGQAWPGTAITDISTVPEDDIYTSLREGSLPLGTYRIELDDNSDTWVHINSENGEIVSVMDRSRRTYRWLYNGLHSLDFPGLVDNRPLWILTMTLLLSAGLAFSLTGIVLAFNHLRRLRLTRQHKAG